MKTFRPHSDLRVSVKMSDVLGREVVLVEADDGKHVAGLALSHEDTRARFASELRAIADAVEGK